MTRKKINRAVLAHHAAVAQGRDLPVVLRLVEGGAVTGRIVRREICERRRAEYGKLKQDVSRSWLLLYLAGRVDPVPLESVVEIRRAA